MTKNRRSDRRQTARNPAPVELTGDAGGGFEAEVAAYFLAEMLRCGTGMGEDLGQIRGVRFQIKDTGSELDDLGLELVSTNHDRRSASVSVKRHRQVTRVGFPPSFVDAVWRQRLAGLSDGRRRGHEVMMLAVGELAGDVESAWQDMLHEATEARGDESRLVQRWTSAGLASKVKRQLFASLQCPAALSAQAASDPVQTVALVADLRLRYFDFRCRESRDRERGMELCRDALESADLAEAARLWGKLVLGECFVALLAEDANVPGVRAEVGAALMSFHYETAGLAMRQGYRLRHRLGDEFLRMQNLAVLYSGLSYVSRFMSDWGLGRSEKWRRHVKRLWHRLHGAFVRRRIPISSLDWTNISDHAYNMAERAWQDRIDPQQGQVGTDGAEDSASVGDGVIDREAKSRTARRHRKARRRHPGFDIQYLPKAFEWLPELNAARNAAERTAWIRLHRQLLDTTLLTIAEADREEGQEIEGTPYQYDHWIFQRIARAVAQMRPDERPDELWRPIFDLGPEAHYWVTSFLHDWLIHGSRSAPTPEAFTRSWSELIGYLLRSASWQPGGSYRCSDVQAALFGIDLGMESIEDARYAAAFVELEPLIGEWAAQWLQDDRLVAGLARFLTLPSADRLLVSGLKWVAAFETTDTKYWRDDVFHYRTSVVSLLSVALTRHRGELATDSEFRRTFQRTLSIMIKMNAAGALQLQDEVLCTLTDGPAVDRGSGAG